MPGFSKQTAAKQQQLGSGTGWGDTLGDYSVTIVSTPAPADLTPLLQGLPDDQCPSPHWGYVLTGSLWFRSGDGEEVFNAGAAFYVAPGHTSGSSAGSEFVIFGPAAVMDGVEANMFRRAQELFGAPAR